MKYDKRPSVPVFLKTGKIRYYVRDFPLGPIHPQAERWAEATHCAEESGHYWQLRDTFFRHQHGGDLETAAAVAVPASDRGAFNACMMEGRYGARVQSDIAEGKRVGITGTPEFLIGYLDKDHPDELKCVRRLSGNVPIADFEAAIESALAAPELGTGLASQSDGDRVVPNPSNQSFFESFVGQPIPAVRADDVRRVLSFFSEEVHRSGPGFAVHLELLADLCDANANVLAVYFRAMLVESLMQDGRLDGWREGNSLSKSVFELAARFPLPRGLGNADLDAFVAALKLK